MLALGLEQIRGDVFDLDVVAYNHMQKPGRVGVSVRDQSRKTIAELQI
jgi:hypothetical protein